MVHKRHLVTYKIKSDQSGGSPRCRICETGADETVSHVVSTCQGLVVEREKILADLSKLCIFTTQQFQMDVKSRILFCTDKVYSNTFWPIFTRNIHFWVSDHKIRSF